jgi:translation initiation factor IF-2
VQNGTLRVGDYVVVGEIYGRMRAMFDDAGNRVKVAPPSFPVVVLGLSEVPQAGDIFRVVSNEKTARAITAQRKEDKLSDELGPARAISLEELYAQMQAGTVKELNIILKADVQGALEPVISSLDDLGTEDLKVKIISSGLGNINESDISLAIASQAIVIGFNVRAEPATQAMAEREGVEVRRYRIIYKLIEDVEKALKGLLEPVYEDVIIGHAEVRATFRGSKAGRVAGVYVEDGSVQRDARARVLRNSEPVHDGKVVSLKRFTEDVTEVPAGLECGVGVEDFGAFEEGDVLEIYRVERVA